MLELQPGRVQNMAEATTQAEQHQNFKYNFRVNAGAMIFFWFGASFYAPHTIGTLFLSYLTDNTLIFSILSMAISTGALLPQLFTASWVQRQAIKKAIPVRIGFFSERLPIMLLPLAAWSVLRSENLAIVIFLLLITWYVFGAGLVAVSWQDMIAKIFPTNWRGRFFGISNFIGNGVGILGASAAAWILDRVEYPYNFMLAFGIGGGFLFFSWASLSLTREAPSTPEVNPPDRNSYWRNLLKIIQNDMNYRQYLISQALKAMGAMALGFMTLYTLRTWDISDSMVSLFTTSILVGTTLSGLGFGWIGDKFGHKVVIEISTVLITLSVLVALLAPNPFWFFLVFALQGAASSGFVLSGISIVFELCDENIRPTYIGLTNTVIGVFSAISPLIGGWIVDALGFDWLFWVSIAFFVSSTIVLRFLFQDPRKSHPTYLVR